MLKTERLPTGWQEKSLNEICLEISAGGTPSRANPEYWINGTIPWLKISDLHQKTVTKSEELITTKGVNESSAKIFPKGTVLFSIFASLGEVAILDMSAATNQAIVGIRPNELIIDKNYLYYYLIHIKDFVQRKAQIGTQKNINLGILKKIPVRFGSIETQRRIVSLLDNIEKLKEKRKRSIQLSSNLIQTLFVQMFGKSSDLIKNEEHRQLSELANLRGGITMTRERREGDNQIPYITVRNLYRDEFELSDLRTINVSESDFEKWHLEYGDLCVLEGGDKDDVGRTAVYQDYPNPCVHQNHIFRIRLNKEILNPFFVTAYFNSDYMRSIFFNLAKATTGINTLNLTELGKIEIPILVIEKQNKFGEIYLKIKKSQNSISNDAKINELYNTILTKAFRGELTK